MGEQLLLQDRVMNTLQTTKFYSSKMEDMACACPGNLFVTRNVVSALLLPTEPHMGLVSQPHEHSEMLLTDGAHPKVSLELVKRLKW